MSAAGNAGATSHRSAGASAAALPASPFPAVGLYRHYKGGWYEVVGQARCSETLHGMALYRPLYGDGLAGNALWVRPAAMFMERGDFNGQHQSRFAPWQVAEVPLVDLPTSLAVVAYLRSVAKQRGQPLEPHLRAPPPEPGDCCERGCNGCVWEGFYTATAHWRDDALTLLASRH